VNTNLLKPHHKNSAGANDSTELAEVKGNKDQFFVSFVAFCEIPLSLAILAFPALGAHAAAVVTTLRSFQVFTSGERPEGGLAQGSDGYLYGTTSGGGAYGNGTVFQLSTNGALTSLYSFTGGKVGSNPDAGLVQGSDGYFYGTTEYGGGANDAGTVFKISTNGILTRLYSFTGGNDGAYPRADLVQGRRKFLWHHLQWRSWRRRHHFPVDHCVGVPGGDADQQPAEPDLEYGGWRDLSVAVHF